MSRPAFAKLTILEALADPKLLGGLETFRDLSTWRAWLVFLRAFYGLPLEADDEGLFCTHTGRSRYVVRPGGYPEGVVIVGRQSGKTRIASVVQAFEAMTATRPADRGELYALSVAQDQRAALRVLFNYVTAIFDEVPLLSRQVKTRQVEIMRLASGITLASYPCRPAALRGLRARVIVCDELAYYRNSENLPVDREMLRAARPCLATTNGRLLILSSPYGQSGSLWELHRKHYGRDDSDVLIWQASAPAMNPTLASDYLARMETDDPDAYRSEVLGEFRAGLATLLEDDVITRAVVSEVRERAPQDTITYYAFADWSGGRHDAAALAIGHRDGDKAIVDVLRVWVAPFNPAGAIAEACDVLRAYRVRTVVSDKYAADLAAEQWRAHGIAHRPSEWDRSTLYLNALGAFNSGLVVLVDDPALVRELRGLERRRGPSGRDRVDHPPGQHDDRANAVCGLIVTLLGRRARPPLDLIPLGPRPPLDPEVTGAFIDRLFRR